MTTKAEGYRAKAQDCELQAGQASDPWAKQQFLESAQQWRRLAEQAESRDRADHYGPRRD